MNAFLAKHAAKQADLGISRTFVMIDDQSSPLREVIGYFTFRPYEINKSQLPISQQRGFTTTIGAYLLAKLGVGKAHQGKGIGTKLLYEVFRRVIALIDQAGGVGLFVDAKEDRLIDYYSRRGFIRLGPDSRSLYIPKQNIAQIVSAAGSGTL
jgi:GNAT superfamily N-acetyltransferase